MSAITRVSRLIQMFIILLRLTLNSNIFEWQNFMIIFFFYEADLNFKTIS